MTPVRHKPSHPESHAQYEDHDQFFLCHYSDVRFILIGSGSTPYHRWYWNLPDYQVRPSVADYLNRILEMTHRYRIGLQPMAPYPSVRRAVVETADLSAGITA